MNGSCLIPPGRRWPLRRPSVRGISMKVFDTKEKSPQRLSGPSVLSVSELRDKRDSVINGKADKRGFDCREINRFHHLEP
ncbi:hypothetical protein QQF64_003285 [Cirrhinus molitorella]|uniref:Uncharacterized protein n=1 Tax=Cirrhinus molitorella TaxID=172907 RepID=A0ABR3MJL8_9TELE